MDFGRLLLENYKQVICASIFLYSNISLLKNIILRSRFIKQFKEIESKPIISLKNALLVADSNRTNKSDKNDTYLIKIQPEDSKKSFSIMRKVKSNQLWLLQPSLNKISHQISTLYNQSLIKKDKKALNKLAQQHFFIQPQIIVQQKQKNFNHLASINGLGQILDHQIFNIKWRYQPYENIGFFTKFRQGLSYYIQFLFFQNTQINSLQNQLLSLNQNRKPTIKGPTIGNIFYAFQFIKNRKILIQAKIQNGQIIAIANAGSKQSFLKCLNLKIWNVNVQIAFFFALSLLSYRMISHKLPKIIKVIKAKLRKLKQKEIIREKGLKQFRIDSFGLCQKRLCIICYTNCRNMIIFNCRHMIMCDECQSVYKDQCCPLCKVQIDEHKILYDN